MNRREDTCPNYGSNKPMVNFTMNREHWKSVLPFITAFIEGKTVACQGLSHGEMSFNRPAEEYTIEAEPEYRPFANAAEFDSAPKMVRHISNYDERRYNVLTWDNKGVAFDLAVNTKYPWKDLLKFFVFLDGSPCGIKVEKE